MPHGLSGIAQPGRPPAAFLSAGDTMTVRIQFGCRDRRPTVWNGSAQARHAEIRRIRPWRFDMHRPWLKESDMRVDAAKRSWLCRTWLGEEIKESPYEAHLPPHARAFIRPGLLMDVRATHGDASVTIRTVQGDFTIVLEDLKQGPRSFLDGAVQCDLAVFATPLALGQDKGPDWHDYPSVSISPRDPDDIWFAWQRYHSDHAQDTYDSLMIKRRFHGQWMETESVGNITGDFYRTSIMHDAQGSVWLVFASQRDGNWDLYATRHIHGQWRDPVRLTRDPQPDMHPILLRDRAGVLWLIWQGFRNGRSDVLARYRSGTQWSDIVRVSTSPANDWEPAACAHPHGGIVVCWDGYDNGNYDIFLRRVLTDATARNPVVRVTRDAGLEARPSVACDARGRAWVAYDTAAADWGKDHGFWLGFLKRPQGPLLYGKRGIALKVVATETGEVFDPAVPEVRFPLPPTLRSQVEYPLLHIDPQDRLWLFCRRLALPDYMRRGLGWRHQWEILVSSLDASGLQWRSPRLLSDSVGRLDMRAGLAQGGETLWVCWASDHRPFMGHRWKRPDVSSVFAARLTPDQGHGPSLSSIRLTQAAGRGGRSALSRIHPNEAADVAAIRRYRIPYNGEDLHIFRGDLHRHTENSPDGAGEGSLLDAYRYAMDAADLDFLLVTDHYDGRSEYSWWQREKSNDLFHIGESFVALYGYERDLPYPNGHRNIFFTRRGVRPLEQDPGERPIRPGADAVKINTGSVLYPYLNQFGGICFSHTSATNQGNDWRDSDPVLEPLVEIFQGDRTSYEYPGAPWSADKDDVRTQVAGFKPRGYVSEALKKGIKLGFQASSDHLSMHISYACILAARNTRDALMDAMKARHTYAATDNIILDVRSRNGDRDTMMGDIFTCPGLPSIHVRVQGTAKLRTVSIIKNGAVIYAVHPEHASVSFVFTDSGAVPGQEGCYYVRAEQEDDMLAWASPMWITPSLQ